LEPASIFFFYNVETIERMNTLENILHNEENSFA